MGLIDSFPLDESIALIGRVVGLLRLRIPTQYTEHGAVPVLFVEFVICRAIDCRVLLVCWTFQKDDFTTIAINFLVKYAE